LRKFFKKIFVGLNVLIVFLTLISLLVPYFNPLKFESLYFPGLLFPFFIIFNFIFFIFWLINKKKWFLLSLLMIIISIPFIGRFYQLKIFIKKDKIDGIKLMSYNVRMFNYYNWIDKDSVSSKIFKFIKNVNPDILCIQEFTPKNNNNDINIFDSLRNIYNYHVIGYPTGYENKIGLAIFCKFPLINSNLIEFKNSANCILQSDLLIDKLKLRIINVHLQSTNLNKTDFYFFDNLFNYNNNNNVKNLKEITIRIKEAYLKRVIQVDTLKKLIKQSDDNIIVCGDFNDTPVSYTYNQINKLLDDAFVKKGRNSGVTYIGRFPGFRIDYVFIGKSIEPISYSIPDIKLSDHYPIVFRFEIKKNYY